MILDLDNLSSATNHNGGAIALRPRRQAVRRRRRKRHRPERAVAEQPCSGKMLRINTDGTIPADNPFYCVGHAARTARSGRSGCGIPSLRVPTRAGRMFINDVGENTWEEINDGVAGVNYGWPATEGATTDPRFQSPTLRLQPLPAGCAITGGAFYSPPRRSSLRLRWRLLLRRLLRRLDQDARPGERQQHRQLRFGDRVSRRPEGCRRWESLLSRSRVGLRLSDLQHRCAKPDDQFQRLAADIASGQSSTLTWSTTNATTVSINQGIGSVATAAEPFRIADSTTTYQLTATGTGRDIDGQRHRDGGASAGRDVQCVAAVDSRRRHDHADVGGRQCHVGHDRSGNRRGGAVRQSRRGAEDDDDLQPRGDGTRRNRRTAR